LKEAEAIFENIFSHQLKLPVFDEELEERFENSKVPCDKHYMLKAVGEEKD
jgi:hypothetical protein